MEKNQLLEEKIRNEVYQFFAEQCNVPIEQLNDETRIIEDIEGDSLMFLQLLELWKREYNINLEFRVIGKYITKNPIETIGKSIDLALQVINEGEKFLEVSAG